MAQYLVQVEPGANYFSDGLSVVSTLDVNIDMFYYCRTMSFLGSGISEGRNGNSSSLPGSRFKIFREMINLVCVRCKSLA